MRTRLPERCAALCLAAISIATACGGSIHGGEESSRRWVLVRVESARIGERLPSGDTWDIDVSAAQAERDATSTGAVAAVLGLVNPAAGAVVSVLSALSSGGVPDQDAPPGYPDPVLVFTFNHEGSSTTTSSSVRLDSVRPTWRYGMYVDLDQLGEAGIDIDVHDFDRPDPARIGGTRLTKRELAEVARSGGVRNLVRSDHELEELVIRLAAVPREAAAPTSSDHRLPLRDGLVRTGIVVPANALVTVKSTGRGNVADGGFLSCASSGRVTPAGLAGLQCREYNLKHEQTRRAAHGSAVALVGADGDVEAVSLAAGDDPEPCVLFLAPAAGEIVFGVNDNDRSNDSGEFDFSMTVAPPPDDTAWLGRDGGPVACDAVDRP